MIAVSDDGSDDPFHNPAHASDPIGPFAKERVEYRVTYEEQCAKNRDHYHVDMEAKNRPIEDVITDYPIEDVCPVCDGLVIGLPNRMVID